MGDLPPIYPQSTSIYVLYKWVDMGSHILGISEGRPSVPSSFLERPDIFFGHPQPLKNALTWRLLALFPQISMGCCCWLNEPRIATPILPHLGFPWCVFVVGSRIAFNRKVQEQRLGATMNPRSWEKTPVTFGLCIHCTKITLDTSGFHLKLLWNHDKWEQKLEIFSCTVYWYLIFATHQSFIVSYHWVNVVWFIIKGLPHWYTVHEPLVIGVFKTRILSILYGSKLNSPWFCVGLYLQMVCRGDEKNDRSPSDSGPGEQWTRLWNILIQGYVQLWTATWITWDPICWMVLEYLQHLPQKFGGQM